MTNQPGPWDRPPAPAAPPPTPAAVRRRSRGPFVIAALVVLGLGVWGLSQIFPGRPAGSADWNGILSGAAMVAIVAASLAARRIPLRDTLRYILTWGALFAVLLVGYSYRDTLDGVFQKVRSDLVPAYAVASGPHAMTINQDANGGFYVVGRVNDQPVTFLVDTGASDIVLSPADARRLGVDVGALQFKDSFETANGEGHGAPYRAARLQIGAIRQVDVPMSINQQPMSNSLLGMAFFKTLESFSIQGKQLRLTWRDRG